MPLSDGRHLNLIQLATLREFARLGTMAAVGESLDYTPGAVSQQVSALERSVGQRLVKRSGRHLFLTDAGRVLVRYADEIMATEREALAAVAAAEGQVAGPLTVGTWGSTAAGLLGPIVELLCERHPRVDLRSKEVDLDDASAAVRRGWVDIAFGLDYEDFPTGQERHVGIVELHVEPFAVAMSPATAPDVRADVGANTLEGLRWILPPLTSRYGAAIRNGFRARGFEPTVVHEVTDTAASVLLAAAGQGATVRTPLMRRLNMGLDLVELTMRSPMTRRILLLRPAQFALGSTTAFADAARDVVDASLRDLPPA